MPSSVTRRKFIAIGAQTIAATACAPQFFVRDFRPQASSSEYASTFAPLDVFIEQYMRTMNSPGMTFVMSDKAGVQRVSTYGFSDPEIKTAVKPDELFHIGSISKSFTAICLLQLRQEGKLDLNKPIADYLFWLRIDSKFAPITTHHLLTHTSGLPGDAPLFLSDPSARHRAAYAPGERFNYCNLAFGILGHLVWTLDGRPYPDVLRARIFEPLGMNHSEPVITLDVRDKFAKSFSAFQNDRPYPRFGRLSEAPGLVMTNAAGCIASTPQDMGLYVQMIANHGRGPKEALLSDESFALFSHPHIKAEEFGPTASYGYGIAVDRLDDHTILRHTGGMVSFASAMHIDIDQGVGAFASINAMQGYRPQPVVQYAIQLMRAKKQNTAAPSAPPAEPPDQVKNVADFEGEYKNEQGTTVKFAAKGQSLFLVHGDVSIPLENSGANKFLARHPDLDRFLLVFGRADQADPKSAVVEVGWGAAWYTNSKYKGPSKFDYPKIWDAYVGHYRNDNPWIGSVRVVVRKGVLMLDGSAALEPGTDDTFHSRDDKNSTDWIRFLDIVNGHAMRLKFSGEDLWRVTAP